MTTLRILLFLSLTNVLAQGRITIPQAINIISKQSMLSQRMAKDKIYNTNSSSGNRGLLSSTIQFENNLSSLKSIKISEEITKQITHLELMWLGYKINIEDESSESGSEIMNYNCNILNLCQDILSSFLAVAKEQNLYPYNTNNVDFENAYIASNNLKYAAQRLSLYYTSYYYKIAKYNNEEFENIISIIDSEVDKIRTIKNLNNEYVEDTNSIELEWNNILKQLNEVRENKFISVTSINYVFFLLRIQFYTVEVIIHFFSHSRI